MQFTAPRNLLALRAMGLALLIAYAAGADEPDLSSLSGRAQRALIEAQAKREADGPAAAARGLEEFLEKRPQDDHPYLQFHLGNHLVLAERPTEARRHYLRAIEQAPEYAAAWLNLGEVAYGQGDYREAGEAFERSFAAGDSVRAELLYYASAAYLSAQEAARAIELLRHLLSGRYGEPALEWYRVLFAALAPDDPPDWSEPLVGEMLAHHGANPAAWQLGAQFAASAGDYQNAAAYLTISGYFRPPSRQELRQLGSLYLAAGIPARASEFLAQAVADSAGPTEYEQLVSACVAAHDTIRAREILARALAAAPTARLWMLRGDLDYMAGRYAEASEAFARAAELDETSGRAHLMLGYCAISLDRRADAIQHLRRAHKDPDQAGSAMTLLEQLGAE